MPKTCDTLFRCPETPHSDVLNQDTATSAARRTDGHRPPGPGRALVAQWTEPPASTRRVAGSSPAERTDPQPGAHPGTGQQDAWHRNAAQPGVPVPRQPPVPQVDRGPGYEPGCWRFESSRADRAEHTACRPYGVEQVAGAAGRLQSGSRDGSSGSSPVGVSTAAAGHGSGPSPRSSVE